MHQVRTSILLDRDAREAARALSAKLGISASEVIRRALASYREQHLGVTPAFRRKRTAAFRKLSRLMTGGDPAAETRSIKAERRYV